MPVLVGLIPATLVGRPALPAAGQSVEQLVLFSPESQTPFPHLQSAGHEAKVSAASQTPFPHLQSAAQEVVVSPASQTPFPQTALVVQSRGHQTASLPEQTPLPQTGQSAGQLASVSLDSQNPLPHPGFKTVASAEAVLLVELNEVLVQISSTTQFKVAPDKIPVALQLGTDLWVRVAHPGGGKSRAVEVTRQEAKTQPLGAPAVQLIIIPSVVKREPLTLVGAAARPPPVEGGGVVPQSAGQLEVFSPGLQTPFPH